MFEVKETYYDRFSGAAIYLERRNPSSFEIIQNKNSLTVYNRNSGVWYECFLNGKFETNSGLVYESFRPNFWTFSENILKRIFRFK